MEKFDNIFLTSHFSLYEMCRVDKYGFVNAPSSYVRDNLYQLCLFLEQLRSQLGCAVIVTSGFRNVSVNNSVGGVLNSDHLYGLAADIRVKGFTPTKLCNLIRSIPLLNGQVGQVIIYPTFLHVSINRYKHKSQYLIKKGSRYEIYKS